MKDYDGNEIITVIRYIKKLDWDVLAAHTGTLYKNKLFWFKANRFKNTLIWKIEIQLIETTHQGFLKHINQCKYIDSWKIWFTSLILRCVLYLKW